MSPIKAIILDVDGVIVGEKIGFNSPYPNQSVINKLKQLKKSGYYIFLCTAKPHYSVEKIIKDANLDNFHITQGGAVIIDSVNNKILKKNVIQTKDALIIIQTYLDNNTYIELYSLENYFIQSNQESHITKAHSHILQRGPKKADSLMDLAKQEKLVKIMPIAKNEKDRDKLIQIFSHLKKNLNIQWGVHPTALPLQFITITSKGISKKQAILEITNKYKIQSDEMLGVGDSLSDWQFIDNCGYGAAMGNATNELKKLVLSKGKDFSFIGKSVDKNGILDIFNHFGL